jgi:hypothetical protein
MSNSINPSDLTPLTIHEFKLFAPARVNQMEMLAFLDTGASHDTVSQKLAEGLPRSGTTPVTSAFEHRMFDTVGDIEIDFLDHIRCSDAYVEQTQAVNRFPFITDVTVGAPTIFAKALILDFRLTGIMRPQQVSYESWTALPAKFVENKDICLIQLTSQSGTIHVLFDTGAGFSVVNSVHIDEIRLDLESAFELEINDATGAKMNQKLSLCSGLRIGNTVLPPFDCFSTNLEAIEKGLNCHIDLILGANAMLKSGYRWLFDKLAGEAFVAV